MWSPTTIAANSSARRLSIAEVTSRGSYSTARWTSVSPLIEITRMSKSVEFRFHALSRSEQLQSRQA